MLEIFRRGNFSPPITGFQRIQGNYCENNPRQGLISWNLNAGDNLFSLDGTNGVTIPLNATFVKISLSLWLLSSNILNTMHVMAIHSMYDNPGTIFCESSSDGILETVALVAGTQLRRVTLQITAPVLTARQINIQVITMPTGGFTPVNFFVFGYWD